MNKIPNRFVFALLLTFAAWGCQSEPKIEMPAPVVNADRLPPGFSRLIPADAASSADKSVTNLSKDGSLELKLELSDKDTKVKIENTSSAQKQYLDRYAEVYAQNNLQLLPSENYEINLNDSQEKTRPVTVNIKNYEQLSYGFYLLPVVVKAGGQHLVHFVKVNKEGDYVPLSDENPKPLPPGYSRDVPMKMVAYVETNDFDIRNYAQVILKNSRKPVFDMIVLFAANMNYDAVTGKRYVHFNKELQPIVNNPDVYIKPLLDRGIKVIVDILPNHQGVGYANFQSYEEALEFAREMKEWTDKTGISGWDIDEEYAEYYKQPQLRRNPNSWMWFAKAVKEVMPDKLLTLYDYAHRFQGPDADGKYPADYIDWSWSNYAENHGSYAGIPDSRYGKLSIEANRGLISYWVQNSAQRNLQEGFGLLMFFNIHSYKLKEAGTLRSLSKATQLFYGEDCEFVGPYFVGPKGR